MPTETLYQITLSRAELEALRFVINMTILQRDTRGANTADLTTLRDELVRRAAAGRVVRILEGVQA